MKPINAGMPTDKYRTKLEQLRGERQFRAIHEHGRAMRRTFKGVMPRAEAGRIGAAARSARA